MLYDNRELLKLVGFSVFELWMQTLAVIIFTIFLTLKVEEAIDWSWWSIFIPLFTADGCSLYFSTIVFIRAIAAGDKTNAYRRALWVASCLALLFLFKMLLCQGLERNPSSAQASLILAPVFTIWALVLIRACRKT
uniref:Transmembrane protein 203-like n=1 Tax=Phallusia mammillata TaxID=59560 RepID=A0A6F9DUE4_9ASCI|nr:transmembrane protein 203-like [Phallusia mammillata]